MTTAAEKIKANAERLRQTAPAKPAASEGAAPAALDATPVVANQPIVVRQKNVRRTVDLSPAAHRNLDNWQRDAADRLGLARVTGQEVLAALVDRLLTDTQLTEEIMHAVAGRRA
ncbi:MAG: hypothetical protein KDB71_00685 [Mycobacterium sp.]|nr:hypothetical protein [Mycobacterium sp.]